MHNFFSNPEKKHCWKIVCTDSVLRASFSSLPAGLDGFSPPSDTSSDKLQSGILAYNCSMASINDWVASKIAMEWQQEKWKQTVKTVKCGPSDQDDQIYTEELPQGADTVNTYN